MLMVRQRGRLGFTLVELLVVISIIGILVGLLVPAVQSAREAARRMSCQNNLKQIALATHMHHDALRMMPPARYSPRPDANAGYACGGDEPTWFVRVLPFIEQDNHFQQWDINSPWYDHDAETREYVADFFLCPSRRAGSKPVGQREVGGSNGGRLPCGCPFPGTPGDNISGALCDYAGNHGDLSPGATGASTDFYYGGNGTGVIISVQPKCVNNRPTAPFETIRMASVTDGTSQTFLIGEKHIPYDGLGVFPEDSPCYDGDHLGASCRLAGPGVRLAFSPRDPLANSISFGAWHPNIVNFAMVDGSVRAFATNTDTRILGDLANRKDNHVIAFDVP